MLIINYTFVIDSPLAQVWRVIADLNHYPQWNPFVVRCQSSLKVGDPIKMGVQVLPPITLPQKETVFAHEPEQYLSYGINLPMGMLSSLREHHLSENTHGQTVYESCFKLQGWLAPLVKKLLEKPLTRGFFQMSLALKHQAESLHTDSQPSAHS